MDTEEIKARNKSLLESMIQKYKLKHTLEEILSLQSMFIVFVDDKENGHRWGFRVLATKLEQVPRYKKPIQLKVNIYNFLKRKLEKVATQEDIYEQREDFIKFNVAWKQLRTIRELEAQEETFESANEFAKVSVLSKLE